MEKKITYNNQNYIIRQDENGVSILKDINGTLVTPTNEEINLVVHYIGGKVVNPNDSLKEDIKSKIEKGEITTTNEIEEILEKNNIPDSEKEEMLNEFKNLLNANVKSDQTEDMLDEYREKIKEVLKANRKQNEFILSSFSMSNGVMKHSLIYTEVIDNQPVQKELVTKSFDYNQRFIDHLLNPSLADFAASGEHQTNEYEIKTNITGDTADYRYVGTNHASVTVSDVSKSCANNLVKLVNDTKVEEETIDPNEEEKELANQSPEENDTDYNNIISLEENEETHEAERAKPFVRVRAKKEFKNAGFMNWKFWLIFTIAISIGLFFLTKYVILK